MSEIHIDHEAAGLYANRMANPEFADIEISNLSRAYLDMVAQLAAERARAIAEVGR